MARAPTAAVLIIGDEILSGRTKDRNIGFVADTLTDIGIDLVEARIVGDSEAAIVEAVRALSERADFVLTSGGIGPTHDDITADAIAKAFGLRIGQDQRAVDLLLPFWKSRGIEPNESRLRMARIPEGATLIKNSISAAPGFIVKNVFVMAGVPSIMQAMMDEVVKMLPATAPVLSETIEAGRGEGEIAAPAAEVQKAYPAVRVGSYPYHDGEKYTTRLVLRSRDAALLKEAKAALEAALKALCESSQRGSRRSGCRGITSLKGEVALASGRGIEEGTRNGRRKGISSILGGIPSRRAGARLAARRDRAVLGHRVHHARRAGAGGDRIARA